MCADNMCTGRLIRQPHGGPQVGFGDHSPYVARSMVQHHMETCPVAIGPLRVRSAALKNEFGVVQLRDGLTLRLPIRIASMEIARI